jgi:hypothetical protein
MMRVVLSATVLWFGVHWAFVAVMHAKAIERAQGLTLYWRVILYPLAAIGLTLDAAFNLTFGTLMFRELPHELLFTARCQRHARGAGRRQRLALWWARQLNQFDTGHIEP